MDLRLNCSTNEKSLTKTVKNDARGKYLMLLLDSSWLTTIVLLRFYESHDTIEKNCTNIIVHFSMWRSLFFSLCKYFCSFPCAKIIVVFSAQRSLFFSLTLGSINCCHHALGSNNFDALHCCLVISLSDLFKQSTIHLLLCLRIS